MVHAGKNAFFLTDAERGAQEAIGRHDVATFKNFDLVRQP